MKSCILYVWKLPREPGPLPAHLSSWLVPFTDTLSSVVYMVTGVVRELKSLEEPQDMSQDWLTPPHISYQCTADFMGMAPSYEVTLLQSSSRLQCDAFNTKHSPRIRWRQLLPLHPKHCFSAEKYVWNALSLYYIGGQFHCRGYSKPLKDVGRSTDHAIRLCSDCFWHGCLETILIKTSWP